MQVMITGANRGIGLEFVRQLLERGDTVFATARQPDEASALGHLADLYPDHLTIAALDVTDPSSIEEAYQEIGTQTERLDLLINNAGMLVRGERFGILEHDTLLNTLHTNAVGPMLVAQRFYDLLKHGAQPRLINMTSQLGSIARARGGGNYSYNASKAALNMLTRMTALRIKDEGIITIMMHPGWVRTDMGGDSASLSVVESVTAMLTVIDALTLEDAGRFLQWDGSELPW
ncbi:MAG: SDR family oxidoreductase [Chloroflexi bacterium]|nr:SDR family oxidoreductase [Chloroflexota bacterium]